MSLLDTLIYGYRTVLNSGVERTRRNKINFGSGLTAVDNPTTGATDVTSSGGGGGSSPLAFDDAIPADESNIVAVRVVDNAAIDNTKIGIVSLGSDTGLVPSLGTSGNYASFLGGDSPSLIGDYSGGGGYRPNARGMAAWAFGYSAFADGEACFSAGRSNVSGITSATLSGSPNLTFAAAGRTLTRDSGDWTVDRFSEGQVVTVSGSASNDQSAVVTSVTSTVLTFISTATIVDEGPSAGISVVGTEKMYATTFGRQCQARSQGSFAAGFEHIIEANADYATAFGLNCQIGHAGEFAFAAGDQCEVRGKGGIAIGIACIAGAGSLAGGSDADGCVALGYQASATGSTAVAIGQLTVADHGGSLALGNQASSTATNACAIGSQASAENDYSLAMGYQCRTTGVASTAYGQLATATRYGELAHSSNGSTGVEGFHALDMVVTGTAAPASLLMMGGGELNLEDQKVYSMRVRVMGSETAGGSVAHEVHEMLLKATGGALSILSDLIITSPSTNFASVGWGTTFSVIGGGSPLGLRFSCDPGADTVEFMARVEWSAMAGA